VEVFEELETMASEAPLMQGVSDSAETEPALSETMPEFFHLKGQLHEIFDL
jgi:hypothetical protein